MGLLFPDRTQVYLRGVCKNFDVRLRELTHCQFYPSSSPTTTMHALQDPSKKTSINSLLNPQEYPAHLGGLGPSPLVPNHAQSSTHPTYYAPGYEPNSYNLRAASWDMADDPHRRKAAVAHQVHDHRPYQEEAPNAHVEQHHPSNNYAYHQPPRMARQRADEPQSYGGNGAVWPTQQRHDSSNMPYGAPAIAPMYSEERTGSYTAFICVFKKGSSPYQRYQPNMQYNPKVRFPLLVLTI